MSCLVHDLHGACVVFVSGKLYLLVLIEKGWYISTIRILDDTLSGHVTQDPRVGPSGACTIHPTHSVNEAVCTGEV